MQLISLIHTVSKFNSEIVRYTLLSKRVVITREVSVSIDFQNKSMRNKIINVLNCLT